jgi:hypothetical protein
MHHFKIKVKVRHDSKSAAMWPSFGSMKMENDIFVAADGVV